MVLPALGAGERRVDGDGQRLLRDPAAAEALHLQRGRRAGRSEVERLAQGGGGLSVPWVPGEQLHAEPDRAFQGLAAHQMADHGGEGTAGVVAGRVAVGDLRTAGREFEGVPVALAGAAEAGEAERRGAHHRSAPLRIGVHGPRGAVDRAARVRDVVLLEPELTGPARSAARVQPGLLAQLPVPVRHPFGGRRCVMPLGVQPPQVRLLHQGGLHPGVGPQAEQPRLGREEGHLGVVGDPPDHPLTVRYQTGDAALPVLGLDRDHRLHLDRIAQRVPDGTAEQTATDPSPVAGRFVPRQTHLHPSSS